MFYNLTLICNIIKINHTDNKNKRYHTANRAGHYILLKILIKVSNYIEDNIIQLNQKKLLLYNIINGIP